MTENKRFMLDDCGELIDLNNHTFVDYGDGVCNLLNELNNENEQLKQELKIYRKIANCGNCSYHNYDWYDDGDEFEVCEKGNDMSDDICEEWREL